MTETTYCPHEVGLSISRKLPDGTYLVWTQIDGEWVRRICYDDNGVLREIKE